MAQPSRSGHGTSFWHQKRGFDVYVDDADDTGFAISRSDIHLMNDSMLDPISSPASQVSVVQQIEW